MADSKKCCGNCAWGIVRHKAEPNAPNVVCVKKSKLNKLQFMLVTDDDKCRSWRSSECAKMDKGGDSS